MERNSAPADTAFSPVPPIGIERRPGLQSLAEIPRPRSCPPALRAWNLDATQHTFNRNSELVEATFIAADRLSEDLQIHSAIPLGVTLMCEQPMFTTGH